MRDTRFIFVEGLMGAGKSTTAEFVTTQLERNGIAAHFLLEGPTIDDPYHPLRVATDLPHPNAAWRDVTIEGFIARSMAKWHTFACQAQQSASPYAMRRSLQGFEGLVHLYRAYRALCDDIFGQLPLPKLVIHHDGDWVRHYDDILTFLALPSALPNLSQAD